MVCELLLRADLVLHRIFVQVNSEFNDENVCKSGACYDYGDYIRIHNIGEVNSASKLMK